MTPLTYTFPSESVIQESARFLSKKIIEALSTHEHILVLLSGGSAIEMYKDLFEELPKNLDLHKTTWALIDERRVGLDDRNSNEGTLRSHDIVREIKDRHGVFLSMIQDTSQDQYESAFADADYVFAFVGIGEDGHTAGWLPTQTSERFQHLFEKSEPLVTYDVDEHDSRNAHRARITLSTHYIKKINQVIIYATGEKKHMALDQFIANINSFHQVPALVLYNSQNPVILLTDYRRIANFNAP